MREVQTPHFNAESYLQWEAQQPEKHEFYLGDIFAMVGARQEHVLVSGNIYASLKQYLRKTPCRAYISDMKLKLLEEDAFFYPDVMVSCSESDHRAEHFLTEPTTIIEVLSESTAVYDKGDKFAAYRTIKSLQEYILVDINAHRVESYRRTTQGEWLLHIFDDLEEECQLFSLEMTIPLSIVFEDIG